MVPDAKRLILFDYDTEDAAFHPKETNPTLSEWKRKNIQNYLLVPDAWIRAASPGLGGELFAAKEVRDFFEGENLSRPPGQPWRTVRANVFQVVDGKKLLFENADSLFHRLQLLGAELTPEKIADQMTPAEIHDDVWM